MSQSSTATDRLPRGPHSLSPDEVGASQRSRILAALTALAAESGLGSVRVADVCSRAGVSNSAFYASFANKADACIAAYDQMAEAVESAVVTAADGDLAWPDFVRAAVGAYLGVLADRPDDARLFILESAAAPTEVRERRRQRHHGFAALIAALHERARDQDPTLGDTSPRLHLAVVEGIVGLVSEHLNSQQGAPGLAEPVTTLEDDVVDFVSAVLRGVGR